MKRTQPQRSHSIRKHQEKVFPVTSDNFERRKWERNSLSHMTFHVALKMWGWLLSRQRSRRGVKKHRTHIRGESDSVNIGLEYEWFIAFLLLIIMRREWFIDLLLLLCVCSLHPLFLGDRSDRSRDHDLWYTSSSFSDKKSNWTMRCEETTLGSWDFLSFYLTCVRQTGKESRGKKRVKQKDTHSLSGFSVSFLFVAQKRRELLPRVSDLSSSTSWLVV